jgi:hypothetical protein
MAKKLGIREFRNGFTTIARKAKEPVIVTNYDRVVGWYVPANRPQRSLSDILDDLADIRRRTEARGVPVAKKLKELGIEDETPFDDPWLQARPRASERKVPRRRK